MLTQHQVRSRGLGTRISESHRRQPSILLSFDDVLDEVKPASEDELVEVITADAAEMILHNQPVTVSRYAQVLGGRPNARKAAIDAHARSLYELQGMTWEQAESTAKQAAASCPGIGKKRSLSRRRLRMIGSTVTVPMPLVTLVVVIVLLAIGWMGQALQAANHRAQAEYERGERETNELLMDRIIRCYEDEQDLREREEAHRLACEDTKDNLISAYETAIALIEEDMADLRVGEAAECLKGFQRLAQACMVEDPSVVEHYRNVRTDTVIMPVLRIVYGEHAGLLKVREILSGIEVPPLPEGTEVDGD